MHRPLTTAVLVAAVVAVPLTPVASAATPYKGANTTAVQDDFSGIHVSGVKGSFGAATASVHVEM